MTKILKQTLETPKRVTKFGMSVFNGEYTDFFYAMLENSKQEHSQLQVSFNVDKQLFYSLFLCMVPTK